ncbi:hypothetical protein ACVIJ6_002460 [Bradyrhizobium sp. USDA 4369]
MPVQFGAAMTGGALTGRSAAIAEPASPAPISAAAIFTATDLPMSCPSPRRPFKTIAVTIDGCRQRRNRFIGRLAKKLAMLPGVHIDHARRVGASGEVNLVVPTSLRKSTDPNLYLAAIAVI